jgi:hypothetical protein
MINQSILGLIVVGSSAPRPRLALQCVNMRATLNAFLAALDNHIKRIMRQPDQMVHGDENQRVELRTLIDKYVDERGGGVGDAAFNELNSVNLNFFCRRPMSAFQTQKLGRGNNY